MQTLVLDQAYAPIKIVSWQRAITLLSLGKVELVSEYDDKEIRSVSLVIKMPAVIRLLQAFRRHKKPVKFSRVNILARDRWKCAYCKCKLTMADATYDHVLPRSQGGKTEWTNICAACEACNRKKANRTPEQAGMKIHTKLERPSWVPVLEIRLSKESLPAAWQDWLYWNEPLEEG